MTSNLSRIFDKHCIGTAAAREIIEAVNAEVEAMAKRMVELEQKHSNKPDKADTLVCTRGVYRFMSAIKGE